MKIKSGLYTSAVLLFLAAPVLCHAQWMTQEIPTEFSECLFHQRNFSASQP